MAEITERVREVMKAVDNVHVLATVDEQGKPHMRWMGAVVESPEHPWTFYLVCMKNSRKVAQIAANANAELLFTNQEKWEIATLDGTARAVDTLEIRQLLWDSVPAIHEYYSGVDDPNMGLIEFTTHCLELLAMQEGHEPMCFVLEG